ncbi:MAG: type IV toxin-antitoxin system AbiEi family antitoxin [Candidatus Altiarchaeota archaeon]
MIKTTQHDIDYRGISKNERYLTDLIKENNLTVFGVREVYRLSSWNKTRVHNTLHTLKEKRRITRIKRDKYALKDEINQKTFEIATTTIRPSYISFWTALNHYGYTDQQIRQVQVITTKQQKTIRFDNHTIEVTTFQPRRFYGYKREEEYTIAEKEKALVDSLHLPEKCGGFNEYAQNLENAMEDIDQKKLIDYVIRFKNKTLTSRAGYMLETLGIEAGKLQKHKSETYVKLNPENEGTGEHNRRWNIIINQKQSRKAIG